MARSVWKGPFVDGYLLEEGGSRPRRGRNEPIQTWSRRSTILPQFVGLTFGVHNGRKFMPVFVSEDMIGHKLGEFSPTRSSTATRGGQEGRAQGVSRMSKTKTTARRCADNEAKAITRSIRTSPRKLNVVAASIRGKKVDKALAELTFSRKRIAGAIKRTLQSAIANAENNHDLDIDRLFVAEAYVGKSIVMKRFHARARGRAGRIEKSFSKLTMIVREAKEGTA